MLKWVYVETSQQEFLQVPKGGAMSTTSIADVICSGCGFPNGVFDNNTVIDRTVDRPELEHLHVTCDWCCRCIPVWTNKRLLSLAEELHFRAVTWFFLRRWVQEGYESLQWVHRLGPDQEEAIAASREELSLCESTQWALDRMRGGEDYKGCDLPPVWACDCGSSAGCQPQLIAVGRAPLEV